MTIKSDKYKFYILALETHSDERKKISLLIQKVLHTEWQISKRNILFIVFTEREELFCWLIFYSFFCAARYYCAQCTHCHSHTSTDRNYVLDTDRQRSNSFDTIQDEYLYMCIVYAVSNMPAVRNLTTKKKKVTNSSLCVYC